MKAIKDELGEFIRKDIGREPMVVPMYVFITKNGELPPKKKLIKIEEADPAGMTIEEQGGEDEG
jgi:hypothetical protein